MKCPKCQSAVLEEHSHGKYECLNCGCEFRILMASEERSAMLQEQATQFLKGMKELDLRGENNR